MIESIEEAEQMEKIQNNLNLLILLMSLWTICIMKYRIERTRKFIKQYEKNAREEKI